MGGRLWEVKMTFSWDISLGSVLVTTIILMAASIAYFYSMYRIKKIEKSLDIIIAFHCKPENHV